MLLPKEDKFFDLFDRQAENLVRAAEFYHALAQESRKILSLHKVYTINSQKSRNCGVGEQMYDYHYKVLYQHSL